MVNGEVVGGGMDRGIGGWWNGEVVGGGSEWECLGGRHSYREEV